MKKLVLIALCVVIPMVGFAQKKGKKGKAKEENADEIPDLREWKDDSEGGASIAEMLKNN